MAKKRAESTDYSKLTLPQIIKRKLRVSTSFLELDRESQDEVAWFIKDHQIDIKLFGERWYDVITGKFYAQEFVPDDENIRVNIEERIFDAFGDFFDYVKGAVYEGTCFYGYHFSEEEIEEYALDIESLNFDAFISETIDDYTFDAINHAAEAGHSAVAERANEIIEWFRKSKAISTIEELESQHKQFVRKFDFWEADHVFMSVVLRRDRESMKDAAIQFACKHDAYEGLSFDEILLTYGREAALQVIENFDGHCSPATKGRRIRGFKDSLQGFDDGAFVLHRKSGFDYNLGLYFVRDRFIDKDHYPLNRYNYFGSLEEFASFLEFDLSDSDLSKAPISREDIQQYETSDVTGLPFSMKYSRYEVKKSWIEEGFTVKQEWFDSEGETILDKRHVFKRFFNFVHFLKGDLSGSDFLLCEGIENIKPLEGLNLAGIKVKSEIAEKLGLPFQKLSESRFDVASYKQTEQYELATVNELMAEHPDDADYSNKVSYITDIHLLHRFKANKCRTEDDVNYVLRTIAKTIGEQATDVTLIGGDTSSDIGIFKIFVDNLAFYRSRGNFFFTLGNHELWGHGRESLDSIVADYNEVLEASGRGNMHLLQNNLFFADGEWKEITERELLECSVKELRERTRRARVIVFGGIGFAGYNEEFNANNGIYEGVLNRDGEIKESAKFLVLYEKVTESFKGRNLIVLTHMPMRDWGGKDIQAKEGVVYINGHNHRNYFYDDGKKRIYADNQVGYTGKRLSLKQVAVDFNYDWFADYQDGIYEITKQDYESFYRGIGEVLRFHRHFKKLYLIKREDTYMFLVQTPKGGMCILNGGSIKSAGSHPLEYFYENMVQYAKSVRMFLSPFDKFEKRVSSEVKKIGGNGRIHGSIVDIDYYNHLYLNFLDGSIIPYFAESMVSKYVYDNIPSLLKYQCPELFQNYERLAGGQDEGRRLTIFQANLPLSNERTYVESTEMYNVSRILKRLQFTTKYNIVRLWNDKIVADASEENGRLIVSGIIDPDSMPAPIEEPKKKPVRVPKRIRKKHVLAKKAIKIRYEKYKTSLFAETGGNIACLHYRGSTEKADYKCNACGYEWSTRPDHFKNRQKFQCPKCGGGKR